MPSKFEKFISFYIGEQVYALPILSGTKFVEFDMISPIPNVDKNIMGLIYDNGHLITAINLKKILKIKSLRQTSKKVFLVFEEDERYYGILIDQGGETVIGKRIYNDKQKSIFKKYIKSENKQNIYILEPDEILEQVNIYDSK